MVMFPRRRQGSGMDKVLVFGRRVPNNDSIMSSLVYAQLHNTLNDGVEYAPVRLGKVPDETAKMFSAWRIPELPLLDRIPAPLPGEPRPRVVLTDHNDPVQSVEGIEHAEVIAVLDHHRVSGLRTFAPPAFLVLPWGATCTIVAHMMNAYGVAPSDVQAACLLSAIMTDTLMLNSPVTTEADRAYAKQFAAQLGVDAIEFGREVFRFSGAEFYDPKKMVTNDVKRFRVAGKDLLVSKYVCPDRSLALDRLPELRAEMEAERVREGAHTFVQCVIDLSCKGSQLLACGDTRVVEDALGMPIPANGVWLEGVISRKSQIVPSLLLAAEYGC